MLDVFIYTYIYVYMNTCIYVYIHIYSGVTKPIVLTCRYLRTQHLIKPRLLQWYHECIVGQNTNFSITMLEGKKRTFPISTNRFNELNSVAFLLVNISFSFLFFFPPWGDWISLGKCICMLLLVFVFNAWSTCLPWSFSINSSVYLKYFSKYLYSWFFSISCHYSFH